MLGFLSQSSPRSLTRSLQRALSTAAVPSAENLIVSPASNPSSSYKDEYYKNRGIAVADKNWTEWSDLPAPYKYFHVKVNPKDVENAGFLWKAMYDWKLAVPAALLVAMPLWMTGNFPGFDERLELSLITILAGTAISREVAPMFKAMKESALETKNKALYEAEASLNSEITKAMEVFKAGQSIPETMKVVHAGERALSALEAAAASLRARNALRDATVAELEYLVQLKASAAGETGASVGRAATAATVSAFEKDAGLQQKSIEAALKALKEGSLTLSEDVVAPTYRAALAAAQKEASAVAATNPFKSAAQRETFDKRFGYAAGGKTVSPGNTLPSPFTLAK